MVAFSIFPSFLMWFTKSLAGDNCGASYLNTNFVEHLLGRLADEHYLDSNGDDRMSMVNGLVPHFEDYEKRNKDISRMPSSRVKIPGLRGDMRQGLSGDNAKRFEDNYMLLNLYVLPSESWIMSQLKICSHDYNKIFLPLLKRVGVVLKSQLDSAMAQGKEVRVSISTHLLITKVNKLTQNRKYSSLVVLERHHPCAATWKVTCFNMWRRQDFHMTLNLWNRMNRLGM